MIMRLLNDVSGRPDKKGASVNFYEWLFIRICGDAWSISSGSLTSITKEELFDIGMKVMPHYSAYEGSMKTTLYNALSYKSF